jgi:hypothetical protein
MASWRMKKNLDATGEYSNPNVDILFDTTPRATNIVKTWTHVLEILECEIIKCQDDFDEEEYESFTTKIRHIAQSKLHTIDAQSRLMPYNNMIKWALEHVDVQTRSIINHQQVSIGSFQ